MSDRQTLTTERPDAMLQHRIKQRAYELYRAREDGSDLRDWLQAEREVLDEITPSAPERPGIKLRGSK
jgi:hypothetical protein